jgi:predicted unusual protein kinase regulating ubiquinone biosynthesis (AarF/ABC1/UbiB family)
LNDVFFKFPFNVPEYFALITRALITLEGIALKGDENFDIFQASYPYAVSHALDIFGYDSVMSIVGQTIKSGGLYDLRSEVVERLNSSVQAI